MGAATSHLIPPGAYDQAAGSITGRDFSAHWFSRIPRAKVHFMIENLARFLDAPGEYFFAVNGPHAGRLFLWPARGIDPNRAVYEVAQTRIPIYITDQHDITMSGLEFRYNDPDDGGPHDNYVGNGSPAIASASWVHWTEISRSRIAGSSTSRTRWSPACAPMATAGRPTTR